MTTPVRLLSPTRRRIWQPKLDYQTPVLVQAAVEIAKKTAKQLLEAGWSHYSGPAEVDSHGWVVAGTDPLLYQLDPKLVYPGIESSKH